MPSELELVDRVKQRFLAHQERSSRRLIPFSILEVSELAREITEEALDFLNEWIHEGSTLGESLKPNTICASDSIALQNVRGEDLRFRVQVRVGEYKGRDKTTRGFYDHRNKLIVIYLSPWLDSNDLVTSRKYDIINENKNILIHEVTHALDVIENYRKQEGRAYYNDPHEVKAFARQVVDEASRTLKGLLLTSRAGKRPMPQGAQLVEALLDGSKTWRMIKTDLNESNSRYIRQVLVRELNLVV